MPCPDCLGTTEIWFGHIFKEVKLVEEKEYGKVP
jgi:hypothetical protein